MIKLEGLKAIGMAEKKLAQKDIEKQKIILQEFKKDPEVAHALAYLERFNEAIPESHPIFEYVEKLKARKEGKEIVQEVIQSKTEKKNSKKTKEKTAKEKEIEELEKEEAERKLKKMQEAQTALNGLLEELELQNDKVFEYVNKNMKSFAGEYSKMSQILKLKRFLISVKNGVKSMRIK